MDNRPVITPTVEVPTISPWLWQQFGRYARFYLRRSFHAIRLSHTGRFPLQPGTPAVVFLNHPSWWDPLVAIFLAQHFMAERRHYGPIDAEALSRYRFFQRLGFFGVRPGTRQGAATFLRVSQAILRQPESVLWVTPEGHFSDPRQRPMQLQPGLGALARRIGGVVFVPLAIEYVFWEERFPEILLRFGEAMPVSSAQAWESSAYTEWFAQRLEATQEVLAREACRRDPANFETLSRGNAGVGVIYDTWRALRAYWRGEGKTFRRCPWSGKRMIAIVILASVLALIPALLFHRNLRLYTPLPPSATPPSGQIPAVSVLIPARNEATSIRAAVEAALHSRDVALEVIVLDEHSEDETAAIVRQLAAEDKGVRLESAPPLPAGWCGKQHACATLAQHASHPLLVFVDAAVRLAPDGLARMAAFLGKSRATLISGVPHQETVTLGEKLLIPLIRFLLLGFLPMHRMRRSPHPAYGSGCGQLFMARREAYVKAGGHAAIRTSLYDGITLPRAFRRAGLMTDLFDATDIATCRMYRSWPEVRNGLAKNAGEGLAAPAMIGPATLLLLGGQVLPVICLLGARPATWTGLAFAGLGVAAAYYPRWQAGGVFGNPVSGPGSTRLASCSC